MGQRVIKGEANGEDDLFSPFRSFHIDRVSSTK